MDDSDDLIPEIEKLSHIVDAAVMSREVWGLIDFCNARYQYVGDSIGVLMQALTIIAASSYVQGTSKETNRDTLIHILDAALQQVDRLRGVQ